MRIIGVLDLMNGVVVRGVGGRRAEYRPITSPLCASSEPLAVAEAMRREYGLNELYLADLDAIAGAPPSFAVYQSLRSAGFRVWVDAGVRSDEAGRALGRDVVVGSETATAAVAAALGDVVFSLDLRGGVTLGDGRDPRPLAADAVARGVGRLLVLDLAQVGEGRGTGTETLCADLIRAYPQVEVWAGGGVRGVTDLDRLHAIGVRAVLVASALHQRLLRPDEVARYSGHQDCE